MARTGKKENLIPTTQRSKDEARELGRKGGVRSGEVRRERKTIAQALMDALQRKSPTGRTYYDEAMERTARNLGDNPSVKDIEVLQKIMGEQTAQKIEVSIPEIRVESKEDARMVEEVADLLR